MKRETTPAKVTDKIMGLCEGIVADMKPVYLPVSAPEWSLPGECFPNVQRIVREQGGKQVNGWAIWQWANILVEAEAHSVWENPEGQLIDITPHDNGESEILFLCDDNMVYSMEQIGSIRLALTESPLAAELIELSEKKEKIMSEYKPGTKILLTELQKKLAPLESRKQELIMQLNRKAERNEPCPCMSGLKYKKCCGKE